MKFYSTQNPNHRVGLRDAVLAGQAPDHGLYMPERLDLLAPEFLTRMGQMELAELAEAMLAPFLAGDVAAVDLGDIAAAAFDFPISLVALEPNLAVVELFHGPTLAFKDVGARFMAQLMSVLLRGETRTVTVLVATSGDTGGAVAHGFHRVPGIEVKILYPAGMVSPIQEKQLTTLGGNITAFEVAGTFDDCQALVKRALADEELARKRLITTANSINIARLLPQMLYYAYAFGRLRKPSQTLLCAVPSGNFGNLTAGLIAKRIGIAIDGFVAATNANDAVPRFLGSGSYQPRPTKATISNAMDVGNPSNFARILDLYRGQPAALRADLSGRAFSDSETRAAIREVHRQFGYIMDPHGAVAYLGLKHALKDSGSGAAGCFLATAHPAKFAEVVEPEIGTSIPLPRILSEASRRTKSAIAIDVDYPTLRELLLGA